MKLTHCKRGHEFTDENTYVTKVGIRQCKACRKETMRLRREGTQVGYANSRKTHCPKGHEYTAENTILSTNSAGNPRRWCKACEKANQARQRVKRYGITVKEYAQMVFDHGGKCAICTREFSRTPHIDHNHSTGQVRGLLCYSCNSAIGNLQEDIQILKNAIAYLESFSNTNTSE